MINKKGLKIIWILIVVIACFVVHAFYRLDYYNSGMWLDPNELPGTYAGYYDNIGTQVTSDREKGIFKSGTHRLDLHADGTYVYVYTNINGIKTGCSGNWEYVTCDHGLFFNYKRLALDKFRIAPEKPDDVGGFWDARVLNVNGRIGFLVNGDAFFYFAKNPSSSQK